MSEQRSDQMGARRWKLLTVLCAVYFMVILDAAIVRVAIPSIEHDLHMSSEGLQWVANAYMLTFGALLLLARAWRLLSESRDASVARSFDGPGALAVTGGLALLMYTLVDAPNAGWESTRTIALFALAGALLIAFVGIEQRAQEPLLPLR